MAVADHSEKLEVPTATILESAERGWLAWLAPMLPDAQWFACVTVRQDPGSNPIVDALNVCPRSVTPAPASISVAIHATQRRRVLYVADAVPAILAIPLEASNDSAAQFHKVVLIAAQGFDKRRRQTLVRLCRWAANAPVSESASLAETSENDGGLAVITLRAASKHQSSTAVAFALVNHIASLCGCERVTVGIAHGSSLRLLAMSGQSHIDPRRALPQSLLAVMRATVALGASQAYPSAASSTAFTHHSEQHGALSLLSIPVADSESSTAIVVLERAPEQQFAQSQVGAIESLLESPLELLLMLDQQDRKWHDWPNRFVKRIRLLFTERRLSVRGALVFSSLLFAMFSLTVPVPERITTRAFIEAADLQVVAAPQQGFLKSAHVRAGDRVTKGQLLATLDDRDLQLSVDKLNNEAARSGEELARALANSDRSEMGRLQADKRRIVAELDLAQRQLGRSELRAPFNGVVLKGDPGQSLGAPVQAGDVLFEVASADRYRLMVEVDEHDVGLVSAGQSARVRMAAMPEQVWQATLDKVLPVAVAEQGNSVFRLPATLDKAADSLRPGMRGVAKLLVGHRPLAWVYTRTLRNRLRLLVWKFGLST